MFPEALLVALLQPQNGGGLTNKKDKATFWSENQPETYIPIGEENSKACFRVLLQCHTKGERLSRITEMISADIARRVGYLLEDRG